MPPSSRRPAVMPLDVKDWDDEFVAARKRQAKARMDDTLEALKKVGFTIEWTRRSVIVNCPHNANYRRGFEYSIEAYDDDPQHWYQLFDRIRAAHLRKCKRDR